MNSDLFLRHEKKNTSTRERTPSEEPIDGPEWGYQSGLDKLYHAVKSQEEEKKKAYDLSEPIDALTLASVYLTKDEFASMFGHDPGAGRESDFVKYIIRDTGWDDFHGKILKVYVHIVSYSGILPIPNIDRFIELEKKFITENINEEESEELANFHIDLSSYPCFYRHVTNKTSFFPAMLVGCKVQFFDTNIMEYGELVGLLD